MAELIIKSKIREVVKGKRVSSDLADALNRKVEAMLKEAAERAERNGRSTVMAHDL